MAIDFDHYTSRLATVQRRYCVSVEEALDDAIRDGDLTVRLRRRKALPDGSKIYIKDQYTTVGWKDVTFAWDAESKEEVVTVIPFTEEEYTENTRLARVSSRQRHHCRVCEKITVWVVSRGRMWRCTECSSYTHHAQKHEDKYAYERKLNRLIIGCTKCDTTNMPRVLGLERWVCDNCGHQKGRDAEVKAEQVLKVMLEGISK